MVVEGELVEVGGDGEGEFPVGWCAREGVADDEVDDVGGLEVGLAC